MAQHVCSIMCDVHGNCSYDRYEAHEASHNHSLTEHKNAIDNKNEATECTGDLDNDNEPVIDLIRDLIMKERDMFDDNDLIIDTIKDILMKERNTLNQEISYLKREAIKHKTLNKRLLRNKVTTSSFSDTSYENSINEIILNQDTIIKEREYIDILKKSMTRERNLQQDQINTLREETKFLREELREKNMFIKILNFRNANDGDKINANLIDEDKFSTTEEIHITNRDDYNATNTKSGSIHYNIVDEVTNIRDSSFLNSTSLHEVAESNVEHESTNSGNDDTSHSLINNRYAWQKHSSGAASKIMGKMGYQGKGLGKDENGRTETISLEPVGFGKTKDGEKKRKLLYILSSSMLNQMDGERLGNKDVEVKVQCHGGCTIRCMYSHLPKVISSKPDYILLHIGSNDCSSNTSDEVLDELKKLIDHLKFLLPYSVVILLSPIVRADNTTAAAVQKNLNVKIRKLFHPYLDNSNIGHDHLGKKGLHLNGHGTKKNG